MGDIKPRDLQNCTINFLGVELSGFGEGSAIKIEPAGAAFKSKTGCDGLTVRSKAGTKDLYKVTVTLINASESNAYLSTVHNLDKAADNGAGVGPFIYKDNQGTSLFVGTKAWIETEASVEEKDEATDREWVFAAVGKNFIGGN